MFAVSTPSRARPFAALACLIVLFGVACTPSGNEQEATQRPVQEKRGPAGAVPAGLGKFYGQSLTWSDCKPFADTDVAKQAFSGDGLQCARIEVPLDYRKPDGKTIKLGLLRKPASDQKRRIGSMLINPGGPGAAGTEAAASLAPAVSSTELGKRFDLVGFDPRGIGTSQPEVNCYTGQERDKSREDTSDLGDSPAAIQAAENEQRDFATKCRQRTGKDVLATVGTRDVVKDMDLLRSALGDKKLTYVGFSYGTRLGTTYAEQFPQNVRALILDGAVDPDQDQVQSIILQAAGFQKAFNGFASWCAQRKDCPLGQNPNAAVKAYQQLVTPLIKKPVKLPDGRTLSYDDATTGTIQALYSEQFWQFLGTGLTQLKKGAGSTLMALADFYNERNRDGTYANTQDASQAIRCVDDPPVTDKKVLLNAQQRFEQAAPFLASGLPAAGTLDSCAFWPVPNTGKPHLPKVGNLPKTLVISTTNDPSTPYQAGVDLAKALKGRLLTFNGTQHTAFLQGNKCVDDAGTRYLVDLKLPEEGKRC
jgi:pimeloyl-ACP methyl ester carboxylesterase